MDKLEFSEALDAFLADRANSWQKFIIEDYCYSYTYCYDIVELSNDANQKQVGDRILEAIIKIRMRDMGEY